MQAFSFLCFCNNLLVADWIWWETSVGLVFVMYVIALLKCLDYTFGHFCLNAVVCIASISRQFFQKVPSCALIANFSFSFCFFFVTRMLNWMFLWFVPFANLVLVTFASIASLKLFINSGTPCNFNGIGNKNMMGHLEWWRGHLFGNFEISLKTNLGELMFHLSNYVTCYICDSWVLGNIK